MSLKLRKRKGSRNWYLRGTIRGIPVDETTGTEDEAAATAIRIQREAELLNRSVFGGKATATFLEAAVDYNETVGHNERRLVVKLVSHFKTALLTNIGQDEVDRAARALYPKAAPETWNRNVFTPMAAILHRASRKGLCDWIRLERPKMGPARVRWLRPEEAERLIDGAEPPLQALIVFLLFTGCRITEALSLDWGNIDLRARHVSIYESKTKTHRAVALNERAFLTLANLPHREGFVFPWRTRGAVYKHWRPLCQKVGIKDLTPHDLRHTYATWLRKYAGQDLQGVMRAGGWRDYKSVMRYAHVTSDEIREAVDKLPGGEISGQSKKYVRDDK